MSQVVQSNQCVSKFSDGQIAITPFPTGRELQFQQAFAGSLFISFPPRNFPVPCDGPDRLTSVSLVAVLTKDVREQIIEIFDVLSRIRLRNASSGGLGLNRGQGNYKPGPGNREDI